MTVTWSNIKIFKIQSGGRPPSGKILAYHNSLNDRPIGTKLGWSHSITFPTCPTKWGCRGNGRCLATALWTFSSYWRLEAERVNQFWWNFVYNSKFGQRWQSCDQILKVGGRSLLESIRNAMTRLQINQLGRNLNGRIPSCSQYWKYYNSSYDGTDWDDSWVVASKHHLCCKPAKPFPWYLVVTANHTVNVLVLWGVEIKNIYNFHETWLTVPLWYKWYIIW